MAVPAGFCEAEIGFECLNSDTTLQIFLGVNPITNAFAVLLTDPDAATVQARIVPIAGVTVLVLPDSFFPLTCPLGGGTGTLHLLVRIASTTIIIDALTVIDSNEGFGSQPIMTPFVCNLVPPTPPSKKKNRGGVGALVRCPDEIIFRAGTSHPQVKYCNNNIYNFYGVDENGLLHYIKYNSNISLRGTSSWWALSI